MTELEFAARPERWPRWPRLPVKRRSRSVRFDDADFGYLVDGGSAGVEPVVVIGNVFGGPAISEVRYDTMSRLLEEWRID